MEELKRRRNKNRAAIGISDFFRISAFDLRIPHPLSLGSEFDPRRDCDILPDKIGSPLAHPTAFQCEDID